MTFFPPKHRIDHRILSILIKGLARNYRNHGAFYCPCRRITGDPDKDRLIICPCAYHEKEIMKNGKCHCGLFVSKSNGGVNQSPLK